MRRLQTLTAKNALFKTAHFNGALFDAGPLDGVAKRTVGVRGLEKGGECRPGVTLMELLVVLVIISILSSMLVGTVMLAGRRRGKVCTESLIMVLQTGIDQYENTFGDYPRGAGGASSAEWLLKALSSSKWSGRQEFDPKDLADTDGNGRKEIVDYWKRPVSYYHHRSYDGPPREISFRIVSMGRDCVEGTSDDITNYGE